MFFSCLFDGRDKELENHKEEHMSKSYQPVEAGRT